MIIVKSEREIELMPRALELAAVRERERYDLTADAALAELTA